MLRGFIDAVGETIEGWAFDTDAPTQSVAVELFVSGRPFTTVRADQPREDLRALGTGVIAYSFSVPAPPDLREGETVFGRVGDAFITPGPDQGGRRRFLNRHPTPPELPEIAETLTRAPPPADVDTAFVARIAAAFRAAQAVGPGAGDPDYGPLWGMLFAQRHGALARAALDDDLPALGAYLADFGRRDAAFGMFDGPEVDARAGASPAFRRFLMQRILDRLRSLAEALGVVDVQNPEQGAWSATAAADIPPLVEGVAATLGLDQLAPSLGGYWGLPTVRGLLNVRLLDALHAAVRIRSVLREHGLAGVTEIGGGVGAVAHAALRLGVDRYRIVDLPTVGMIQAFTLRHIQGVALHGEDQAAAPVRLVPDWAFAGQGDGSQLLVNLDSLPELDGPTARAYLAAARDQGFRRLLSINQESGGAMEDWRQGQVRRLAAEVRGYRLLDRRRDWMRPGYVEELFAIDA